jgi:hypothetical protein
MMRGFAERCKRSDDRIDDRGDLGYGEDPARS